MSRTSLKEKISLRISDHDMRYSKHEFFLVDFLSRRLTNHLVVHVYDVEDFGHLNKIAN